MRIMPYQNKFQMAVTFEFWDTKQLFIRTDYGVLDFLSDIGGLYGTLTMIAIAFIGRCVQNGPSLFVA